MRILFFDMVRSLVTICLLAAAVVGMTANPANQLNAVASHVVHAEIPGIRVAVADTVFMEVSAGETLIFALPDSLSEAQVQSWRIERSPAYSTLHDNMFVWKTRPADRGLHPLHFEGTSEITVDNYTVSRIEIWTANVRVR